MDERARPAVADDVAECRLGIVERTGLERRDAGRKALGERRRQAAALGMGQGGGEHHAQQDGREKRLALPTAPHGHEHHQNSNRNAS